MRNKQQRIQQLIDAAERQRWQVATDINWHLQPSLPFFLPRFYARRIISQLYYGEVATADACTDMAAKLSGPTRQFLLLQAEEERRHADAYLRYANALGGLSKVDAHLIETIRAGSALPSLAGRIASIHVLLEQEAMGFQHKINQFWHCPLLRQINRRVSRDEARHTAFGRYVLPELLAQHTDLQHTELYWQLHQLWWSCIDKQNGFSNKIIALITGTQQNWAKRHWQNLQSELFNLGLRYQPLVQSTQVPC